MWVIIRIRCQELVTKLSHALAGRKFRGASMIFLDFTLRSDDHTT